MIYSVLKNPLFLSVAFAAVLTKATYTLEDDYGSSASFLDKFDFFTVRLAFFIHLLAH